MDHRYFNRITAVYGLGVDEFLDLFAEQSHSCAVCKTALVLFSSAKREKPVVDHCHVTGKVRGILCYACNAAVGWLENDPERTRRAAGYIVKTADHAVRRASAKIQSSATRVVDVKNAKLALVPEPLTPAQSLALIAEFEEATLASRGSRLPDGKSDAVDAGMNASPKEGVGKAG